MNPTAMPAAQYRIANFLPDQRDRRARGQERARQPLSPGSVAMAVNAYIAPDGSDQG